MGNAVQRNRARRLLREVIRRHLADIEPGWDCVLIARQAMHGAAYGDVETAVSSLLTRLQLLKAGQNKTASQETELA